MRAVLFAGAGGNEVVSVQERPDPVAAGADVLVAVRYAGVNPADVLQRAGRYPAPVGVPADVPGLEVAGVIVAVGSGVSQWSMGDRVLGIVGGGGLADLVVVPESCLARIPDALDEQAAAAVPEAFMTAHDAVLTQAGLRRGEVLLVHGAAGGVGSAAVQIGVAAGARVFGVVRSEAAAGLVRQLGAEPLADEGFADAVLSATRGLGADVILELVGSPHFPANLDAVATCGRIMVVGVGAGSQTELSMLRLMQKRASIRGTVLRARPTVEKAAVVRAFEREVLPHLATGRIRPVIDRIFPADRAPAAFDRIAARGKTGKVLLDFGNQTT